MAKAKTTTKVKASRKEIIEQPDIEVATTVDEKAVTLTEDAEPKVVAKSGKRSAKVVRDAEAEVIRKEQAKVAKKAEVVPAKRVVHVPNDKKRHGKAYRAAKAKIEQGKLYDVVEAVALLKTTAVGKFDNSIEIHAALGVDPRQADQMVRASVMLPHGTGKTVRVAVIALADKHAEATEAGADLVGEADLLAKIEKGVLDFDVLVATPDMMVKLAKVAKVLGPRGLMPNPKSGTVTPNIVGAIKAVKAGKVNYRIDRQAIVHFALGKVNFEAKAIEENVRVAIDSIMKAKPSASKGIYVKSLTLTTTMGPGIKLDTSKALTNKR